MMEKGKGMPEGSSDSPMQIPFHYHKSNYFRVIHGDGVIGDITPRGDLFLSFFSERLSVPDRVTFEINEDGSVGKEIDRTVTSAGLMREMEVGVVLDLDAAKNLLVWLSSTIRRAQEVFQNNEGEQE